MNGIIHTKEIFIAMTQLSAQHFIQVICQNVLVLNPVNHPGRSLWYEVRSLAKDFASAMSYELTTLKFLYRAPQRLSLTGSPSSVLVYTLSPDGGCTCLLIGGGVLCLICNGHLVAIKRSFLSLYTVLKVLFHAPKENPGILLQLSLS